MKRPIESIVLSWVLVLAAASAIGQESKKPDRTTEGIGMTIYSSPEGQQPPQPRWNPQTGQWENPTIGFAIVKDWRKMTLAGGRAKVR